MKFGKLLVRAVMIAAVLIAVGDILLSFSDLQVAEFQRAAILNITVTVLITAAVLIACGTVLKIIAKAEQG